MTQVTDKKKAKTEHELMAEQGYLPATPAAECVGVELSTLHRWIKKGDVTGTRVGEHWYVSAVSLLARYSKTPLEGRVRGAIATCGAVLKR